MELLGERRIAYVQRLQRDYLNRPVRVGKALSQSITSNVTSSNGIAEKAIDVSLRSTLEAG